jgi:hypothetical protein
MGGLHLKAKKETLHQNLRLLSPIHLQYVLGLVNGLCYREHAGKEAEPEKPAEGYRACHSLARCGEDSP